MGNGHGQGNGNLRNREAGLLTNLFVPLKSGFGTLPRMNQAPLNNIPTLPEAQLTSLPQEIQDFVCFLHAACLRLTEEVADLKARLAKDSTNSHKPPSNEGMRKPKSQRIPSNKPPG